MKGNRYRDTTLTIDGKSVRFRNGQTILELARKAGIYIPTLCHLESLEPFGGCRLCVVEIEEIKGYPASCTTPALPGMKVTTRTPELQRLRREIFEFTLSEHPYTCLVCKDKKECSGFMHTTRKAGTITGCNFCTSNGDCELQDLTDYLDLEDLKFPITYRGIPPVRDNPFYDLDYNLCVLCGRCVRICNEGRYSDVLSFVQRGNDTIVGTAFGESQYAAGCEFCGACADVCPTGSISEKVGKWRGIPDRSVKTTCTLCQLGCEMNVNAKGGKIIQIGSLPGKRSNPPQLCIRGKFLPMYINDHPSRVTTPLIRKNNRWVEADWKEAIMFTLSALAPYRGKSFGMIASGQDTLEDTYALQKFTREVMNSANIDLYGSYQDGALQAEIERFLSQNPSPQLDQIEKTGTLLVIGMDGSVSHPLLEQRIRKAFRSGNQVVYADLLPSRTSLFANYSLHYLPGQEVTFLQSLLSDLEDHSSAGEAASLLLGSSSVVVIFGDGMLHGPDAMGALQTLFRIHTLLSRDRNCSILFAGYEGNLQAGAMAGAHPGYTPGLNPAKPKGATSWNRISSGGEPGVRALMLVGDLPAGAGLDKLDLFIQCNTFLTAASEKAHVVLPITDFLENEGHVLTIDRRLKKVNRVVPPPGKTRSIAGIVKALAKGMKMDGFSSNSATLFRELRPFLKLNGEDDRRISHIKATSHTITPGPEPAGNGNPFPVRMILRYNHFRYRGNCLHDLIPELSETTQFDTVGLPVWLMTDLKLNHGDPVRIVSASGGMNAVAQAIPGIDGNLACLSHFGNGTSVLGTNSEKGFIDVRIENV